MLTDYKIKTELHAHTRPVSSCSDIPAENMAAIYAELGFDVLCITNHFVPHETKRTKAEYIEYYLNDYKTVKKCAGEYGLNVIFGVEYRMSENHNDYLIFGIDENDLEELFDRCHDGIDKFYSEFKNDRRVIIQAHPFRNGIIQTLSVDGYEVYNMHPHHNQRTSMAARFVEGKDTLVTCGTDFHHFGHEGSVAMLSKTKPKDSFELAALIKSRDYLFKIGEGIVLPYSDIKV